MGFLREIGVLLSLTGWAHAASWPESSVPTQPLDLCAFRTTFSEDFKDLSISAWGNGRSRWIAHTPWAGDFGDAAFADPQLGFPFSNKGGVLRIEARQGEDRKWRSGLLASVDTRAQGFAQQYGYFEMKAKLPAGPGLWPAFWLDTAQPRGSKDPAIEIDIMEHYGHFPGDFHSVLHVWDNSGRGQNAGTEHVQPVPSGSLSADFHTYGAEVAPDWITFYFDRRAYWRIKTPDEHKKPLMVLVNLALGSGWPIDQTPSPSFMEVASINVYERQRAACGEADGH